MSWSRPSDLRAQVLRLWDRGILIRSVVTGAELFPLRLTLKTPSAAELLSRFDEVREWTAELRAFPYLRIEMRTSAHRVLGSNLLPHQAWIDSLEDSLRLIGKTREMNRFQTVVDETRTREPALLDWIAKRPFQALALSVEWPRLLEVIAWLRRSPRPGIYLRQADIPGVHSKFIEAHLGILGELLDITLPAETIDFRRKGRGHFAARYGFREKPARVRFRVLDPALKLLPGKTAPDITLDAPSFAALNPPVERIFITENEINFLAFPPVNGGLVIFGAGYGWSSLADAQWLHRCALHYWGDLDTHGFAILDQLRSLFPQAESFLMDRETLIAHRYFWGQEEKQLRHDLTRLNPSEGLLYDDLRYNRIGHQVRLEQEVLNFACVRAAVSRLMEAGGTGASFL